jgi:hypothetical protein
MKKISSALRGEGRMKSQFSQVFTLVIAFSLITTSTVFATPVTDYEASEVTGSATSDNAATAASHVRNGDFEEWQADSPSYWRLSTKQRGREIRWDRVDLADSNAQSKGGHNYALGLFIRSNNKRKKPTYGTARAKLDINTRGSYQVTVHTTAWGKNQLPYNFVAWYAIYPTKDADDVPSSAWRELYPNALVCDNESEQCPFVARQETVVIEPDSYLFLRGMLKFREWQAWAMWVWDDISVIDVAQKGSADTSPPGSQTGWTRKRLVTWNRYAPR